MLANLWTPPTYIQMPFVIHKNSSTTASFQSMVSYLLICFQLLSHVLVFFSFSFYDKIQSFLSVYVRRSCFQLQITFCEEFHPT